jgi:hypothetical protein
MDPRYSLSLYVNVETNCHVWNELTQQPGKQLGYAHMVGNIPRLTLPSTNTTLAGEVLYVPLEFWFNRNAGLNRIGPESKKLVCDSNLQITSDEIKLRESPQMYEYLKMVKTSYDKDNPQRIQTFNDYTVSEWGT